LLDVSNRLGRLTQTIAPVDHRRDRAGCEQEVPGLRKLRKLRYIAIRTFSFSAQARPDQACLAQN
jgi:hypothetical protein